MNPKVAVPGLAAKVKAKLKPNSVKKVGTETQTVKAPQKAAPKQRVAPMPPNVKPRVPAAKPAAKKEAVVLRSAQKAVAKPTAKKSASAAVVLQPKQRPAPKTGSTTVVLKSKQKAVKPTKVVARVPGKMGSTVRPATPKKNPGGTLTR